jgi:hypothetical protein
VTQVRFRLVAAVLLLFALSSRPASAEEHDERTQYPSWLANSYVDIEMGSIHYPFSATQLEPGFAAQSVDAPSLAIRLLLGHRFSRFLSTQISYGRPMQWVHYRQVNGRADYSVWMNVGGLTLQSTIPIGPLALEGEAGFGVVTRSGFDVGAAHAVTDLNYGTLLYGGGLQYHLGEKWQLGFRGTYAPGRTSLRQPRTFMLTTGLTYTVPSAVEEEPTAADSQLSAVFPRGVLQAGYATDAVGLGVNHFVSRTVPIFWGGLARVHEGALLRYEHNVFHTRRMFSLDWGMNLARWQSAHDLQTFYTASIFPLLRFTPVRSGAADFYFAYSVAGPTWISKTQFDGRDTGRRFTFQDSMGLGTYLGRKRSLNLEVRVTHYSNGNLFPRNAGVTIPLAFNIGHSF